MKKASFHETCEVHHHYFLFEVKGSFHEKNVFSKTLSFLGRFVDPGWVMRSQANVYWNWPAKPCYECIVAAAQVDVEFFLGQIRSQQPEENTRKMGTLQKCRSFFGLGGGGGGNPLNFLQEKTIKVWWNIIPGMASRYLKWRDKSPM